MLWQKNSLWIHPLERLWGGRWCAVATAQPSSSWADARGRGGGCWPPYPLCKIADPVPETKGCRLSWLTNSALVYEPKCGGERGELRGISQWVQLYTGAQINFGDLTLYSTYAGTDPPLPNKPTDPDPDLIKNLFHKSILISCIPIWERYVLLGEKIGIFSQISYN